MKKTNTIEDWLKLMSNIIGQPSPAQSMIKMYREAIENVDEKTLKTALKKVTCAHQFGQRFPLPSEILAAVKEEPPPNEPIMWDCICCGVKFPAGDFMHMKCGCNKHICYECQRCEKHCRCENGPIAFEQSKFFQDEIKPKLDKSLMGKAVLKIRRKYGTDSVR